MTDQEKLRDEAAERFSLQGIDIDPNLPTDLIYGRYRGFKAGFDKAVEIKQGEIESLETERDYHFAEREQAEERNKLFKDAIEELESQLKDRSEKYKIAMDKGVLQLSDKIKALDNENQSLKAEVEKQKEKDTEHLALIWKLGVKVTMLEATQEKLVGALKSIEKGTRPGVDIPCDLGPLEINGIARLALPTKGEKDG